MKAQNDTPFRAKPVNSDHARKPRAARRLGQVQEIRTSKGLTAGIKSDMYTCRRSERATKISFLSLPVQDNLAAKSSPPLTKAP
ncbi:hypothetical protein WN944_004200 [Citrus x changshan-huyou]|uniref:Uncharacterized protein n=1 Tax=Citrus x changshan-huyou TaxID=2935761 RepID=A0AAP0M010_9ROSI